jgi:hypothetical protein
MKWGRVVERVMKQKNLTLEDAVTSNMAKSDSEPVTGVTLDNSYR